MASGIAMGAAGWATMAAGGAALTAGVTADGGLILRDTGGGVCEDDAGRTPDALAWRTMPQCLQRTAWEIQSEGMWSVCLHPGHVACTTVAMTADLRTAEAAPNDPDAPSVRIILS